MAGQSLDFNNDWSSFVFDARIDLAFSVDYNIQHLWTLKGVLLRMR